MDTCWICDKSEDIHETDMLWLHLIQTGEDALRLSNDVSRLKSELSELNDYLRLRKKFRELEKTTL